MKKRKIGIAALAIMTLTLGGSIAYFTDSVTNDVPMDSGSVILQDDTATLGKTIMVPGDSFTLPIQATQVGKNTAKVRLRIMNHTDNTALAVFANSTADKGFVVQKDGESVNIAGQGYIEETPKAILANGKITFNGLTVKLLEKSGNEYQNQITKLTYVIEAMQDDHTEWTQVDGGDVSIETQR